MDISRTRFPVDLIKIIQEVADAYFIAIDLEFTGVADRRGPSSGKLTLQEFYDDVRDAARKYQILQVGLTIVKEDIHKGCYVVCPYNFNIDPVPLLKERYFTRAWSYQSGAVSFLLQNGFNFHLPYTQGIHYLSHKESEQARAAWIREDEKRNEIPNMPAKAGDFALINHVRTVIQQWQASAKEEQDDYVNIPGRSLERDVPESLNKYQIRLTHQTVREEFPRLKTMGMGHFVRVTNPTEKQQASERVQQSHYREREISKSIGFRWLIDAIIGNDIRGLPDEYLFSAMGSKSHKTTMRNLLEDLQERLQSRRRILVGHNCFTDLVNLYRCFVGDLPEKVEDFQERVHEIFPAVIDTKYLASFGKKWNNTVLEDVERELRGEASPLIEVPAEFDRYQLHECHHEAGYDSLLTARIAVKLSAKLAKEAKFKEDGAPMNPSEDFGFGSNHERYISAVESLDEGDQDFNSIAKSITSLLKMPVAAMKGIADGHSGITTEHSPRNPSSEHFPAQGLASEPTTGNSSLVALKQNSTELRSRKEVKKVKNALASKNIFEVLSNGSTSTDGQIDPDNMADLISFSSDEENTQRTTTDEERQRTEAADKKTLEKKLVTMMQKGEMMPRWNDHDGFWNFFGNKLQVNGCQERVCPLT